MNDNKKKSTRRAPKEISGFKIPRWWECQWRRISCKRSTCTFCGRVEDLKRFLSDEGDVESQSNLSQVIHYQAKDLGIPPEYLLGGPEIDESYFNDTDVIDEKDFEEFIENRPPEADSFMLYRLLKHWSRPLVTTLGKAENKKEKWVAREEAQDLMWYATMLPTKVYRQLSTRWETRQAPEEEKEMAEEFARIELGYTGYILLEITDIIELSLRELIEDKNIPHKEFFGESMKRFRRLRSSILEIASP